VISPHQRVLTAAALTVKSRRIRSAPGGSGRVRDGGLLPAARGASAQTGGAHQPGDPLAAVPVAAVAGSANTAWVSSSPRTVDATAPWFPVQNRHRSGAKCRRPPAHVRRPSTPTGPASPTAATPRKGRRRTGAVAQRPHHIQRVHLVSSGDQPGSEPEIDLGADSSNTTNRATLRSADLRWSTRVVRRTTTPSSCSSRSPLQLARAG
jgi:hypothetical protein